MYKYIERLGDQISSWESKVLLSEKISSVTTPDGRVSKLVYDNARIKLKFNGDLLKQNKVTYIYGPIVNIYIVYRLIPTTKDSSVTLQNCLFGAVKLTKNADIDKYKARRILVLGKNFIQGIDGTTIYAGKRYSTNFTVDNKTFCLSLHCNGDNSYLFDNGKEIINSKAKNSEIVPYQLCLGNISKDFMIYGKTGLTGYIYHFSVDYWGFANDKILE